MIVMRTYADLDDQWRKEKKTRTGFGRTRTWTIFFDFWTINN